MAEPHTHGGTDAPECTTCTSASPKRETIVLTESEAVYLINESGPRGTSVHMGLGTNVLTDVPSNEWARELILNLRFNAPAPGALAMQIQESYR